MVPKGKYPVSVCLGTACYVRGSDKVLEEFNEYRVDGKFSSACGSQQHLYDDVWMIGWGRAENDTMCMCVYDFAADKELISMTLANGNNFTYRCVYYE